MRSCDTVDGGGRQKRGMVLAICILHVLVILILAAPVFGVCSITEAQGESEWSPHGVLFAPDQDAGRVRNVGTSLVADQTGAAHLVWLSFPEDDESGSERAYYYSRWDGKGWTPPVDVFAATSDLGLGWPVLVPTPDGRLHIFWAAQYRVMHSWAWAASADSARAWAPPDVAVALDDSISDQIDVKLDASAAFHVVYVLGSGDVYYTRSNDGVTWSPSVAVSAVGADTTAWLPKLDVADDGRIHVVWTEWQLSDGPSHSLGVYYAHSVDNGLGWSAPIELGGVAHSDGNVLAIDDGTVYVAWNGGIFAGPHGGRFFRHSGDRGVTWDGPVRFSPHVGQAGFPSMVVDSGGVLHILTASGEYATWDGETLSSPQVLRPHPGVQTENSRLVVVNGSQLVAVLLPYDWVVYFTTRQLDVPPIPTILPLTPTSPALKTATPTYASATAAATMTVPEHPFGTHLGRSDASSSHALALVPILIGAGLPLGLVGVVVVAARMARKGR